MTGSYNVARQAVLTLKEIVEKSEHSEEQDLMEMVRRAGLCMTKTMSEATVIKNMVQRVLKIIHDECTGHHEKEHQESLQKLLLANGQEDHLQSQVSTQTLKVAVLDAIAELLTELDTSAYNIATQARRYIHTDEVIMTAGQSKTVQAFFKKAAKRVRFQVIVAEHAPFYDGQEMAAGLAKEGIKTTVITDSAVFAMMSRVNKVILGTHTVLANGGLKAINGSHAIALAAKYYSVPLIVCAAMFKLSPDYLCSYDQDINKIASPQYVVNYSEGNLTSRIHVQNPVFDYVPPELVTSFISNIGGNAPSYVYRLLEELYPAEE